MDCRRLEMSATDAPDLTGVDDDGLWKMFSGATSFNSNIEHWDVSHIKSLAYMFEEAVRFNQPLAKWNTGHVMDMGSMFKEARSFNQPIGHWDVSHVKNMGSMFQEAHLFNQPIGNWNVSHVTNMESMFDHAYQFDQPLDAWDVSHVWNMDNMFRCARGFRHIPVTWITKGLFALLVNQLQKGVVFSPEMYSFLEASAPVLYVLEDSGILLETVFLHEGAYVNVLDHPECLPLSIVKEILTSTADTWLYYEDEQNAVQCLKQQDGDDCWWLSGRYEEMLNDEDMYERMAQGIKGHNVSITPYCLVIHDGVVKLVKRESYYTVEVEG